jgi:hypothetical protein
MGLLKEPEKAIILSIGAKRDCGQFWPFWRRPGSIWPGIPIYDSFSYLFSHYAVFAAN